MEDIKNTIQELVYYWICDPATYINHKTECKKELDELLDKLNTT